MEPQASDIPPSGRILAVDPGSHRIGLAVSDPLRILAGPLTTLEARSRRRDAEAVAAVAREQEAVAIVVGLPVQMDGSHGAAYEAARKLLLEIRERSGLPVFGWDERLTSRQAERTLIEAGARRRQRRQGGAVDRVAAALLLESFLATVVRRG